jgi:hypothetical protein
MEWVLHEIRFEDMMSQLIIMSHNFVYLYFDVPTKYVLPV